MPLHPLAGHPAPKDKLIDVARVLREYHEPQPDLSDPAPPDGGFKYNPPDGGPADTNVTKWIQERANALLAGGNRDVKRMPYERALKSDLARSYDYVTPYVRELGRVIDLDAIRSADLKLGVDPLGGASIGYW